MGETASLPRYSFGDIHTIDRRDMVGMSEGHKLKPDEPHRSSMWEWCTRGISLRTAIGESIRFKLPSFMLGNGRRYTTVEAYQWWVQQINDKDWKTNG